MKILSIETSCDESAIAIIDYKSTADIKILSNIVISQIDIHKEFGGVHPSIAKREHNKNLPLVLIQALEQANLLKEAKVQIPEAKLTLIKELFEKDAALQENIIKILSQISIPDIDRISVTIGPGLPPALWTGVNFAKALAILWHKEIVGVNHMEGHVVASLLEYKDEKSLKLNTPNYPALALLISGGHTEIVRITKDAYNIIGETLDDAVGEAFDKVARQLGLQYPGGPEISKLAEYARRTQIVVRNEFRLPRPMLNSGDLNFSFSGLKTAVATAVKKAEKMDEQVRLEIALEFENSATDVIVRKCEQAIYENNIKSLIVGGGVSANQNIRTALIGLSENEGIDLYLPQSGLSTDNALMIAVTSALHKPMTLEEIVARSNYKISEVK